MLLSLRRTKSHGSPNQVLILPVVTSLPHNVCAKQLGFVFRDSISIQVFIQCLFILETEDGTEILEPRQTLSPHRQ